MCGTCTAGCPVSSLNSDYNPRRIMRMVLMGMKEEVLSSPELWQCNQCHACVAHCPQNAGFADVMRVLRQICLEDGYVTREFVDEVSKIDIETRQQRIDRIKKLDGIKKLDRL
jgi:heterodisulfide reductase subunit C